MWYSVRSLLYTVIPCTRNGSGSLLHSGVSVHGVDTGIDTVFSHYYSVVHGSGSLLHNSCKFVLKDQKSQCKYRDYSHHC